MKIFFIVLIILTALVCCTKRQGKNPSFAFNDVSLLDSCKQAYYSYYKNDAVILLSGAHGPHGTFKLRFNPIAFAALTDYGKLPVGKTFPDGSLLIKDIYRGNELALYAFMYKHSGSWLWAEIQPDGKILHSVNNTSDVCTNCHNQSGNRDLVVSFSFY